MTNPSFRTTTHAIDDHTRIEVWHYLDCLGQWCLIVSLVQRQPGLHQWCGQQIYHCHTTPPEGLMP